MSDNKTIHARIHRLQEFLVFCDKVIKKYPFRIPKSAIRKLKEYKLFLVAAKDDEILGHIFQELIKFHKEFMGFVDETNNGNQSAAIEMLKKSMETMDKCDQLMKEVRKQWRSI